MNGSPIAKRKPSSCVKVSLNEKCESRVVVDIMDPLWLAITFRLLAKNVNVTSATKTLKQEPQAVLYSGLPSA